MTQTTQTISPLRQRMLDDMRSRKFAPKTQTDEMVSSPSRFGVECARMEVLIDHRNERGGDHE